jgi:hypothetical protein
MNAVLLIADEHAQTRAVIVDMALTLRRLGPDLRVALHSEDADALTEQAREHCLPLFDDLDRALRWVASGRRRAGQAPAAEPA